MVPARYQENFGEPIQTIIIFVILDRTSNIFIFITKIRNYTIVLFLKLEMCSEIWMAPKNSLPTQILLSTVDVYFLNLMSKLGILWQKT